MTDREIDALVAEHVFGFTPLVCDVCNGAGWLDSCVCNFCNYTRSPAASKALREKMRELGWLHRSVDLRVTAEGVRLIRSIFVRNGWEGWRDRCVETTSEEKSDALAALSALRIIISASPSSAEWELA